MLYQPIVFVLVSVLVFVPVFVFVFVAISVFVSACNATRRNVRYAVGDGVRYGALQCEFITSCVPATVTYTRDNSAALNGCRKHNGGIITHDKNQTYSAGQSPHAINITRRRAKVLRRRSR